MKKLLCTLAVLSAFSGSAEAANLTVLDSTGTTRILGQAVDSSGNLLGAYVICGTIASVTLYATCVNQLSINASGQMLTLSTLAGTLPAFAAPPAVNVAAVPADASVTGSPAITAADAASTSIPGARGLIFSGTPTAGSVETFSLATFQGVLVSARGTFSPTTTVVLEQTVDPPSAQSAGTAHWTLIPGTVPFNAPFESVSVNVGGEQGIRCRVPAGLYTTSDSITCTVRTSLTDPNSAANPFPAKPGTVIPLGYCQLSVSTSAVQTSTCSGGIPVGTTYTLVCNEGTAVRWLDTGVTPTASFGQILSTGTATLPTCSGFVTKFAALQWIAESGTTILDLSFYK
jgi:hypothetical protein